MKTPPAAAWTHGATTFLLLGTWSGDDVGDCDGESDGTCDADGGVPFMLVPVRRAPASDHGKRSGSERLVLTGEPFINPVVEEAVHAQLAVGGAGCAGCTRGRLPRPLDALAAYAPPLAACVG